MEKANFKQSILLGHLQPTSCFSHQTREEESSMLSDVEGVVEQIEFSAKNYHYPPPAPFIDFEELTKWSFYRALITEFIATLLFLYVTILTVIAYSHQTDIEAGGDDCGGVSILGIAWAFGGMIFVLVYCTAGISGGHINPAVTFGLFLAMKVSLLRAFFYMVAQCLGAICGVGFVKAFQKSFYHRSLTLELKSIPIHLSNLLRRLSITLAAAALGFHVKTCFV